MNASVVDDTLAALAEPVRRRIVELLADHPLPVGIVAQRIGLRQPQATKHLQVLARAGLVTVYRLGQRRVCALDPAPLRALATELGRIADATDAARGDREVLDQFQDAIAAETRAARADAWADGRTFRFHRTFAAPREVVWRHWTEPGLQGWWAPPGLRVSKMVFDARPGGQIALEYRDAEDLAGTEPVAGRAKGVVDAVTPGMRLQFRMSVLGPDGGPLFTGRYEVSISDAVRSGGEAATDLDLTLTIADSTVAAAPPIAGIELGWAQTLDNLARTVEPRPEPHERT